MSYHTYTTDAIVCGSRERGAADRMYWLFTRDAGMVIARAQSVRETRSKLRYGLQDFGLLTVSLVRGKQDWRVVGVEAGANLFLRAHSRDSRGAVLRGVKLLRRLVSGEEAHPHLFAVVRDGLSAFAQHESVPRELEQLFTLRVLYELGYIASEERLSPLLSAGTLAEAYNLFVQNESRASLRTVLEESLAASQL